MVVCHIPRNSWIPTAFSILLSTGIILSFILAYARNAVKHGFPHISDTAGQQPQSGIFCIFLFLSAFTAFLCMMVRYASVSETNVPPSIAINVINKLSLLFGALSLAGMIIVAAYPLSDPPSYVIRTEWKRISTQPHSVAAIMLFSCVNVYCALHTILTIMQRKKEGIVVCCLRVGLFIFTIASFITMKVHGVRHAASKNCEGCVGTEGNQMNQLNANDTSTAVTEGPRELTDFDKSAISELGLAVCLVIYFLTFVREFHHISVSIITKYEAGPRSMKPSGSIQMTTSEAV